jgi:hypothetical protein
VKVSQPTFIRSLDGRQKTIVLLLVLAISTFLSSLVVWGYLAAVLVSIFIIAILWVTKPLWGAESRNPAFAYISVVGSVALAVLGKQPESKPIISTIFVWLHLSPEKAAKVADSDRFLSCAVMVFVLLGVYIVSRLTADRSAMGEHPIGIDKDFPEQDYKKQRTRFIQILDGRLSTLDDETKWDEYYFTPLDADVSISSSGLTRKRVVNLMSALKVENGANVVLLLGDPGAGKSIALRKLAKDLLKEVDRTGRVPVYVNLKEWASDAPWDENNLPTADDLKVFVLSTLKGQNSFADQFLSQYYDRMFDRGRFFFLLDSFDEIPSVLDAAEASTLVERLSLILTEFFASQDEGRGVVSSRFYRRPRFSRASVAILEIRPFSDQRIYQALRQSHQLRPITLDRLFTVRSELVPIARNPFAAALIRMYAEANGGILPDNQLEMYDSYLNFRLAIAGPKLQELGLTSESVQDGATAIAWAMFSAQDIGLEASVSELETLLPNLPIHSLTSVLRYSGLARLSTSSRPRFSFVHRRFNEYFVARRLLLDPSFISLDSIPSDSRYRDALALYCEVGTPDSVRAIADFCWEEIDRLDSLRQDCPTADRVKSVHCLRFLRDAFGTRVDVLSFRKELAVYIESRLQQTPDLLDAKIALEASGLLTEKDASRVFISALNISNSWLSDSSLRGCRNLSAINTRLHDKFEAYLLSIPTREVLRRADEIRFSLSLSDAFKNLKWLWIARSFDARILCVVLLLALFVSPFAGLVGLFGVFYLPSISAHGTIRKSEAFWRLTAVPLILLPFLKGDPSPFRRGVLQHVHRLLITAHIPPSYLDLFSFHALSPVWRLANHHRDPTMAFVITLALLLVPWCHLMTVGRAPSRVLLTACMLAAMPFCVALLLRRFAPAVLKFIGAATLLFFVILSVALVGATVFQRFAWSISYLRDRVVYGAVTRSSALSRGVISEDFLKFITPWFRKRYVSWLRDIPTNPIGDWPTSRPNIENDVASTTLAQLDERWMGLDT